MNSEGLGLNERGDVVGRSSFADFTTEAFFFDGETEELVPLGFLDGEEATAKLSMSTMLAKSSARRALRAAECTPSFGTRARSTI